MGTDRDESLRYDAVIFDFRGVIYRKTESDRRAFFHYLRDELGLPRDALRQRMPGIDGHLDPRIVVQVIEASIECPSLHQKLRCAPGLRRAIPIQENIDLLHPLSRLYRLGLLANSDGTAEDRLREMGLRSFFTSVIDSHRVGLRKPDPAIYLLAAQDLDTDPQRCVFIDDRIENVETAKALGMKTIHHDPDRDNLGEQLRQAGVLASSGPTPYAVSAADRSVH